MLFLPMLVLALQTTINNPAAVLYDRIFNEQQPAARLKLIAEFDTKYVASGSKLVSPATKAQVLSFATDIYEQQKNAPKMVEYGEKTLRYDPDSLRVLVLLAHQYVVSGANVDRAAEYAKRALAQCQKLQNGPPQKGFTRESWAQYLKTTQTSAQSTLDYIRTMTQRLLRSNP